jgi:hypothetical protein
LDGSLPKLCPAVALSHQDDRHSAIALLLKVALIQVSDYRLLGASGFMVSFNTGDLLIEVTSWTGLTVYTQFCVYTKVEETPVIMSVLSLYEFVLHVSGLTS